MAEPKLLNLKDIWNSITEKEKHYQPDENQFLHKQSIEDIVSNTTKYEKEVELIKLHNELNLKKSAFQKDEAFENLISRMSLDSCLETPPFSHSNLESPSSNSFNSFSHNYDDFKDLFPFPKSDNLFRNNKYNCETEPVGFKSTGLNEGINEKFLNKILDNLIAVSNQKDILSKTNVINVINNLLKTKLTKQQYQKVQNVVQAIYGNSNNYYKDPLQGFYNQELLMLLLKNQNVPSLQNDNLSELVHLSEQIQRPEPIKSINHNNSNRLSLKDEIAMLSLQYRNMMGVLESDIEKAAALYRTSATAMAQRNEAAYEWTGKLPTTTYKLCQYSRKVFLGGVPWDSSENDLISAFIKFGYLTVMFPQKDLSGSMRHSVTSNSLKGYCYIIFESEDSVNRLLNQCIKNESGSGDFYKISSPKFRSKDVQVIPWMLPDSQYSRQGSPKPDSKKTVFVGALHGMMTAYALATVMNELFDNVIFTALDTDKYKYPIGSGRVTFSSQKSYMRAVTANFIHVKTAKFSKTIQIDPYLEDSMCNNCFQSPGIYFCRSFECFRYFCSGCWQIWHNRCETLFNHKPLRRTFKPIFDLQ